ncbi:MAG: tetratricopeptide repeat protein [Prevotellaceae bacterium]|jgi:tetratricopeptide (TPR) repeat protein|nr:tetratricopeptide repeat protein [Prevotellaceae bacterium]
MKKIITSILFVVATGILHAQIVDSIWVKANNLYASGDYHEAITYYNMIEASGEVSADLFYNIGNAYFKQNIVSKAILYYERAIKLRPGDADISHNLALANAMTVDKIEAVPEFFVFTWIKNLRNGAGTDTWAWLSIIFFTLGLLLFGLFLFAHNITLRKFSFFLSILILLGSINCGVFAYYQKKELHDTSAAIITPAVITVKSSPDTSGKDLFILHEGTKVTILETLGEWQCIKLADGKQGWILKFAAEII